MEAILELFSFCVVEGCLVLFLTSAFSFLLYELAPYLMDSWVVSTVIIKENILAILFFHTNRSILWVKFLKFRCWAQ